MTCVRKSDAMARLLRSAGTGLAAAALLAGSFAQAQAQDAAAAAAAPASAQPSPDAMTNLIRLLVAQGTITRENGDKLLAQAQAEAVQARAAIPAPPPPPPAVAAGAVRVTHVPDVVRQQIKDELRQEVMAQASSEGWVTKEGAAPEWTRRITVFGDVRIRSQSDFYSKTNSTGILDLAAMNAAGPIDLTKATSYQFLDTTRDRIDRLKFRARLGVTADIAKGVTATVSIGSGEDNSPVSQNQILGGGFAQRPVWVDLANVKASPWSFASAEIGRFENPFNSTTLLYDEDLRFDGVAGQLHSNTLLGSNSLVSLTGGAFPLDYGSENYPNVSSDKRRFPSKWLFAGEIKAKGAIADGVELTGSAGYHSFQNVQGRLSNPCNLDLVDVCSTDGLAPHFLRKGNTLFTMRDHLVNSTGVYPELFGLKFKYDIVDLNLGAKVPISDSLYAGLSGNYVRNIGFRHRDICNGLLDTAQANLVEPFNNTNVASSSDHVCATKSKFSYIGGNIGWLTNVAIGSRTLAKRGSWRFSAEYRYLQSDAVLDAYTDSDFHLGGTNAKGYILDGEYWFGDRLSLQARWYSANEVAGDPFAIDVLLVDLKARF